MSPRERLGQGVETLPVIQNNLLRKEHVEYSIAWQKIIGPKNKVLYNGMGPDVSTVLLFSNANEIVGLDPEFHNFYTEDYINKYWDFIDKKPIPMAGAVGYRNGYFTPENFQPTPDSAEMFREDLEDRKRRGYWNTRSIINFDIDRLLILELKSLGVHQESIKVRKFKSERKTIINFDWAFPGEKTKPRKITYLSTTFDRALDNGDRALFGADCYYQKAGRLDRTYADVQRLPFNLKVNSRTVVAIGYQYKANKDNAIYKRELGIALGRLFKPVNPDETTDQVIDQLPEADPPYEENKYGMKLHVFERPALPLQKYKTANRL